jgi:hypothetical protein
MRALASLAYIFRFSSFSMDLRDFSRFFFFFSESDRFL